MCENPADISKILIHAQRGSSFKVNVINHKIGVFNINILSFKVIQISLRILSYEFLTIWTGTSDSILNVIKTQIFNEL
jgi:hypothetical protein